MVVISIFFVDLTNYYVISKFHLCIYVELTTSSISNKGLPSLTYLWLAFFYGANLRNNFVVRVGDAKSSSSQLI